MRDYLIFAIILGLLPFALKRPVIGLLAYVWISLMNPHRLTFGFAYDFPFAALVAGVTLIGLLLSNDEKRLPVTAPSVLLIAFLAWITLTSVFAFNSNLAWQGWSTVVKTVVMTLVVMSVVRKEQDVKALAWVMALSLGFYGLKGGIFTLTSGGVNRVVGPFGTYISDNNTLALGLIVALPFLWFIQSQVSKTWLRLGFVCVALLTLISIIGSYSRGALLGGGAMLFFLWLKSRQKLLSSVAIALVAVIALQFMPQQWSERMNTIDDYEEDASAMGRINGWQFAINVASVNVTGGGFNAFTPEMFHIYAPIPTDYHVAHSIYFQVLGDHGYVGLSLFVLLLLCTWRTASQVKKRAKKMPQVKWAGDLAMMSQVSLVGYAVAGAFLSMPYYDFFYYTIALIVLLDKLVKEKERDVQYDNKTAPLSPIQARHLQSDFV